MTAPDPLARVRAIDAELVSLYARVDALLRERAWLTSRPRPAAARRSGRRGRAAGVRRGRRRRSPRRRCCWRSAGCCWGPRRWSSPSSPGAGPGSAGGRWCWPGSPSPRWPHPALLLRRRLAATAETVAAIGLLLCLLDAYAVRRLDLAGLGAVDGRGYAAGVLALLAAGWAGYGALLPLRGPAPTAVVLAQLPLPLLALSAGASPTGLALALLGGPALDLALARPATSRAVRAAAVGTGAVGWGLAVLVAAAMGFDGAEVPAAEAGVLVLAAALALAAAVPLAAGGRRDAGVGLAVLVLAGAAVAAGRVPLEAAVTGGGVPLAAAVVGLLVALLAARRCRCGGAGDRSGRPACCWVSPRSGRWPPRSPR